MRWHWIQATIFALPLAAGAQEPLHHSSITQYDSSRAALLGFERVLNTFIWNGSLFYNGQVQGLELVLDQRARSRLIRTEHSSIQDEYQGKMNLGLPLQDRWNLKLLTNSHVLSDSRAVDLTKFSQHQALTGLDYRLPVGGSVSALGGVEVNAQQDERDMGFTYLAQANIPQLNMEEIRSSMTSFWSRSFLGRRNPEHLNVTATFYRDFGEGTNDSLSIHYNKLRREFYVAADPVVQSLYQTNSNIFVREAEAVDVSNRLSYRVANQSLISLQVGFMNRSIDRSLQFQSPAGVGVADPHIQETQIQGALALDFAIADWGLTNLAVDHSEKEESHSSRFLNTVTQRTALSASMITEIGSDDLLKVSGSASIFRYDTPDTTNTEDRDELYITLGLEEEHRFSRFLKLVLQADVLLNHLVYLHRLQSANNAWNRVFRFSPKVEFTAAQWFRTTNVAEVLANYTVYDFEEQVATIRSFSFRQASWFDSTMIRICQSTEFFFLGGVRIYERGILKWKEFKERPENYFVEKNLWPQVFFVSPPGLRFGFGFRYFSQDRYAYTGSERMLDLQLETSGPTAVFEWIGKHQERVSVEGWRETQRVNGQVLTSISNLSIRVSLGL